MKKLILLGAMAAVVGSANAAVVYSENWNSGIAASGWTSTDDNGSGLKWADMSASLDDNYASTIAADQSNAPIANSEFFGEATNGFDTSLRSAAISLAGFTNAAMTFDVNFQAFVNNSGDQMQVMASSNGTSWTVLDTYTTDTPVNSTYILNSGVTKSYNLSAFDGGNLFLRFRFNDPTAGAWEWYAQVDNLQVTADAVPEPASMVALGAGLLALARRRRSK